MRVKKGTATCQFFDSGTEKSFDSLAEARAAAEKYCGNALCAIPFAGLYLYGPGDGTTSVLVREDVEFKIEGDDECRE